MTASLSPPITVLLPVYNAAAFLREAIESILNQTFRDFEFLIINDGSTDDSENIILSFKDPRIRYVKNDKNLRLIATLNKGIDLSSGKYIARMDADDISLPERLQVQYDFMEQHPEVAICGSWYETIGSTSRIVKYEAEHQNIMFRMLYQSHLCHPSVIIRKDCVSPLANKFDPEYLHAEDYELFARLGEKHQLANIQKVLLKYRHHEGSVSLNNQKIQYDNSIRIRKNLFAKLGLEVTEAEIILLTNIAHQNYEKSEQFLQQSKQLLEKMQKANQQTHFFEQGFFKNTLAGYWFNVCYNLSSMGGIAYSTFYNSQLHQQAPLKPMEKIKFFVKSRFRL